MSYNICPKCGKNTEMPPEKHGLVCREIAFQRDAEKWKNRAEIERGVANRLRGVNANLKNIINHLQKATGIKVYGGNTVPEIDGQPLAPMPATCQEEKDKRGINIKIDAKIKISIGEDFIKIHFSDER